jgi:hypothetical protein
MKRLIPCAALSVALVLQACGGTTGPPASDPGASAPSSSDPMMSGGDVKASLDQLRNADSSALHLPRFLIIPGNLSVFGHDTTGWTEEYWRWILSIPASQNPELVDDADCAIGQTAPVFYLPGEQHDVYTRSCTVRFGKPVLWPIWSTLNDYPCPNPNFHPAPGQSLVDFLTEGAVANDDAVSNIMPTVDGKPIDFTKHRFTTGLFNFTGDPSLTAALDPCITGTPQPAVSDGWWLLLLLGPGDHTLQSTAISPGGHSTSQTFIVKVRFDD